MIAMIAEEKNFNFSGVDLKNEGYIDIQGLMGVEGVSPHFQKVNFDVILNIDESDERIEEFQEEVQRRCPAFNLLVDAGIKVNANWVRST